MRLLFSSKQTLIICDRRLVSERRDAFVVLPVYGAMPFETQCKIFEDAPKGKRKVKITTQITILDL